MARESTEAAEARIHSEAMTEFDEVWAAQQEVREQCLEDRLFCLVPGGQWAGPLGDQFENMPQFEFNKVHLGVLRIINEYRNNRMTADFVAKDGSEDEFADNCDGLYRADEQASGREPQDNAFSEGASGGMGAWRLRTCNEDEYDETNTKQRVRFEPIHDADQCVFFDLGAKSQDKRDAKRCYVLVPYTPADYEAEFDDDPASWPKGMVDTQFEWYTPDLVYVCEHYRVEEKNEKVYWYKPYYAAEDDDNEDLLKRVTQSEFDAEPGLREELKATGWRLQRSKKVKVRKVHKYLLSAAGVIEDCGYIAGTEIPIVVTYGKRDVVNGVERCMGHVRLAKDAQRLVNMLMSWLAEMAAREDMQTPIVAPEQIARHATMWARRNIDRFGYLLLDPVKADDGTIVQAGPLGYTQPAQVPPLMAALFEMAYTALNDMLGGQQAGEEVKPNISGKVVELVQNRLDMQVFIYMDNMAQYAMKRSGEIWLSMMRDIVVEDSRKMKTVSTDGKAGSVVVNEPKVDEKSGATYTANDFAKASFDVIVDVGPSSASKRASVVRALTGMAGMTPDPEMQKLFLLGSLMNLEGEGMNDFRDYARMSLLRQGIGKPTDEEKQILAAEQQGKQPDPQALYLTASANDANASAGLKQAQAGKAVADTALSEAKTQETLAGIDSQKNADTINAADALQRHTQPPEPAKT